MGLSLTAGDGRNHCCRVLSVHIITDGRIDRELHDHAVEGPRVGHSPGRAVVPSDRHFAHRAPGGAAGPRHLLISAGSIATAINCLCPPTYQWGGSRRMSRCISVLPRTLPIRILAETAQIGEMCMQHECGAEPWAAISSAGGNKTRQCARIRRGVVFGSLR